MTTPDPKELEDICYWMYESSGNSKYVLAERKPLHPDEAVKKLQALFTTHQLQLLRELKGQAIKVDRPFSAGGTVNKSLFEAVPVSVIENLMKGLQG